MLLRVTSSKDEKKNLDFEVSQNSFSEMIYYTTQNYLRKM